jgi:hypothetical protein
MPTSVHEDSCFEEANCSTIETVEDDLDEKSTSEDDPRSRQSSTDSSSVKEDDVRSSVKIGDVVETRDEDSDDWLERIVVSINPLTARFKTQVDGSAREFKQVRRPQAMPKAKFKRGDLVTWFDGKNHVPGKVAEVSPDHYVIAVKGTEFSVPLHRDTFLQKRSADTSQVQEGARLFEELGGNSEDPTIKLRAHLFLLSMRDHIVPSQVEHVG